jgi:ferredoxin-NADP reductase/DMSO/TMAO reductase YedYZ heme-binding membrane subunit
MKVDRFTKRVFGLNCLVPVLLLGWDAWNGRIGANPVNFAIRTTGMLALVFLLLSLAITPTCRITTWGWLGQFRRMLGLFAFFHAALHFLLFFALDRGGSVGSTVSEIVLRPYLMVGMVSLVSITPLAVTSTNDMIKRLGPARWKALHRLAYFAAAAGALHYYMLVKADVSKPTAFAIALSLLLLYRLVAHYRQLRTDAQRFRSAPPVAAAVRPRSWSGKLNVAQVFQETPDVRTFRLVPASGSQFPFAYLPGQYLNLTQVIDGRKVKRAYTIASAPSRSGYCEITVKREEQGLVSRHLHDVIRKGDVLDILGPAGRFTFTGVEADSVVLIAGGVGITPLMSQIRYLTDTSWSGDIYVIFSVKTEQDIVFRDELEILHRRHSNLHVTITLSRDSGSDWSGERGRITPGLLSRVVPEIASRRIHLCGPTEMTDPVRQMLRHLGVMEAMIHVESFASPSRAVASTTADREHPADAGKLTAAIGQGGDLAVTFARSGRSGVISAEQTILEAAEHLGVSINYDCRAGICGQCKVRLLAGHVVMESDDALDQGDRANNLILCCQSRCLDQVVVQA